MPTFDEWFKAKYGSTFERLHQAPMTPYDDTIRALTEATREYVTEVVTKKDILGGYQRQITQLLTQVALLEGELTQLRRREFERALSTLRFS